MPNHCENHTSILGPKEDIERLFGVITAPADDRLLVHLYPVPEGTTDTDAYDWCWNNWGTKWGDYDHFSDGIEVEHFEDGTASLSFSYHTAWGPFDTNYWTKVSTDWPSLWFTTSYSEPGCQFVGAFSARNGVVKNQETNELPDWSGDEDDYCDWLDAVDQLRNEYADMVDELIHKG